MHLSKVGARFISEQINPDLGTKRRYAGEIVFKKDIFPVLQGFLPLNSTLSSQVPVTLSG